MFSTAFAAIGSFFGGIQTYLIVAGVVGVMALAGGFYLEHRLDAAAIADMKLADANAEVQAVSLAAASTKRQDAVTLKAAVDEATAQQQIVTRTVTLTKEIPIYVTQKADAVTCIPVGLERLLYAAAKQADPATFNLAAGQSDDACSDVTASALAGWFKDYSAASEANSEQLTALQAWLTANHAAQVSP